ncbi:plasma membrane localization protein [Neurospora sp. IMI 360204]|nr:plasma membrane localization protein [Neurospora sp. IMI 360204]
MNALQEKCRPKHQVLVLKCYPRTIKGAVDVKPNSSELSYLLFYCQSRRAKIQKVGSFLEKKTASDVYRQRIGNVQVTLQILAALIEKSPKDLPLFASCVLSILEQVLKSSDITMVESSIPTFQAFCEHHDPTSLAADQAYFRQYVSVVQQYASLASTRPAAGSAQHSKPIALRWRNAGLEAIRSVASSDALSSMVARQYDIIVPMILENLWTENEDFLDVLLQRAEGEDKVEDAPLLRRRTSNATAQASETNGGEPGPNPIAFLGTAVDVDKLAEEDIGVLAMQCLRQVFVAPSRSQTHNPTIALLRFIEERVDQNEQVIKRDAHGKDNGWAVKVFLMAARWAPVADRFTILLTAIEVLAQRPLTDDNLRHHNIQAAMISALLRSDVNLIGLSVMDVLLNLLGHMQRLVQMPGDPDSMRVEEEIIGDNEGAIGQRRELLFRLQQCIGDLATHVYYADQISDMIQTILLKLRPSKSASPPNSSPNGERSENGAAEDQPFESLFALTVAKIAALRAIKAILRVANPRTKMSGGNINLSRNRVPIQTWDGTQWLLRDPDGLVRKAYVDAVVTWLDRETTPADSLARDESARATLKNRAVQEANLARRVVSSASARVDKSAKVPRSHFLQLLHLAIYDHALQFADYENDLVLLHVLLAKLVSQLGVNAAKFGIPMIFRLQEDIQEVETPLGKVRIGSLVHGYLWTLTEKFGCEGTGPGRAIHGEIIRRRSKNFWVEGINIPAPTVDLVGTPGQARPPPKMNIQDLESEALLPFDERAILVDCICTGYQELATSPPTSPTASPGRNFTHPILGSTLSTIPQAETQRELPPQFRELMLGDWTREAVLANAQAGSSKTASLNGSRSGTTGTHRNTVNNNNNNNNNNRLGVNGVTSPYASNSNLRPSSSPTGANGVQVGRTRKTSIRSNAGGSPAHSTYRAKVQQPVTSVEQLKAVLSGHLQPPPTSHGIGFQHSDDSDDSLVSYDAPSELSFNPAAAGGGQGSPDNTSQVASSPPRRTSQDRNQQLKFGGPLVPGDNAVNGEEKPATAAGDDVPNGAAANLGVPVSRTTSRTQHQAAAHTLPRPPTSSKRSIKSRAGSRAGPMSSSWLGEKPPAMDLAALLKGIDSAVGKPPY